jgi:hypothetical protein
VKPGLDFRQRRDFCVLQNVQTSFRTSRPPIQWISEAFPYGLNGRGVRLTIHLHLVLRLRTSSTRCGVHRDNFTCKFTRHVWNVYASNTTELQPFKTARDWNKVLKFSSYLTENTEHISYNAHLANGRSGKPHFLFAGKHVLCVRIALPTELLVWWHRILV